MPVHKKKRNYEMGRQPTLTKLGPKSLIFVKGRGGNIKQRALRNDFGNYTWGSESIAKKTRVMEVVYNATNRELVKTKTLVKNSIVQVDATPFKQYYLQHYGVKLGKEKEGEKEPVKQSKHLLAKLAARQKDNFIDQKVQDQFNAGRLLACISSRPGQSGRCDGYILEGKELEFYIKKMERRRK